MQTRRPQQGRRLRPHVEADSVRGSHRNRSDGVLDQRDGTHRAAAGPALCAFALRAARWSRCAVRCRVAETNRLGRQRRGGKGLARLLREVLRHLGNGFGRRAVPHMRIRRDGPGKRQEDDQRGRLQCLCQDVEYSHVVFRRFCRFPCEVVLPMGEGQDPERQQRAEATGQEEIEAA